jgi:hypothetical protein
MVNNSNAMPAVPPNKRLPVAIGSPVFWNFEDLHCKLHRKANTTDFPRSVPCHHAAREAA